MNQNAMVFLSISAGPGESFIPNFSVVRFPVSDILPFLNNFTGSSVHGVRQSNQHLKAEAMLACANLFPDELTIVAAFRKLEANHKVRHVTVMPGAMDDPAWVQIIAGILSVEKVFTLCIEQT